MMKDKIIYRSIIETDIDKIARDHCAPWSTVEEQKNKWNNYYQEQQLDIRAVCIVEQANDLLGYGSLLFESKYFTLDIPEIHDIWIYKEYRQNGLGTKLISWLENLAKSKNYKTTGIGVGLYADYGAAQRLYVSLGYIPDGKGVTYNYKSTTPGDSYRLDDDLVL